MQTSTIKADCEFLLFLEIWKVTDKKQAHIQYDSKLTVYLFWQLNGYFTMVNSKIAVKPLMNEAK